MSTTAKVTLDEYHRMIARIIGGRRSSGTSCRRGEEDAGETRGGVRRSGQGRRTPLVGEVGAHPILEPRQPGILVRLIAAIQKSDYLVQRQEGQVQAPWSLLVFAGGL
jgi:hypothetical protein